MHLSKSYRLLRFLNRKHSVPTRGLFAAGAWSLSMLATLRPRLAGRVASIVWADDFKSGLRLTHWFARRGWLGIDIAKDPYFDFASWFTVSELDDLEAFVERRRSKTSSFEDAADRLYVLAARAHLAIEAGNVDQYRRYKGQFEEIAALAQEIGEETEDGRKDKPNKFSPDDATYALRDFSMTAKSAGVEWYAISGTFLGVVREGGWLPHDYDIDVGVHAELTDLDALRTAILNDPSMVLRKEDWQLRIVDNGGEPSLERRPVLMKIVHRTGINIDVFVHYLEAGIRWHGSNIHRWDNADFELGAYRLAGLDILGPLDADKYLTENYGDWRTPVTEFSASTGTPNLRMVENLMSRALFARRYGRREGGPENPSLSSRSKSCRRPF